LIIAIEMAVDLGVNPQVNAINSTVELSMSRKSIHYLYKESR